MAGPGDVVGGIIDLASSGAASDVQRQAQRKAQQDLNQGYGTAINLAAPMQQQSQNAYSNLNNQYGSGDFQNPTAQAYNGGTYDPNSVLSNPQYQAQVAAGTNAINSGAAGKGMEFSGNTAASLQALGQQDFNQNSNDLYNQFNTNRDFNANQATTAYGENAQNNATNFNEGNTLAGYAPGALENSINLNLGNAQANADADLGVGATRANAINGQGQKIGQLAGSQIPNLSSISKYLGT